MEMILGYLMAYIVNCIPTPNINKATSMSEKLEECYKKAVDDWNVDRKTKQLARNNMQKYLEGLRDIITCKKKGWHPKECELLKLWVDKIMIDPECSNFILASKVDYLQLTINKGYLNIDEILIVIKEQNQSISKISEKVNQLYKRGVTSLDIFWKRWGTGPNGLILNYDIVLNGRESESLLIEDACKKASTICVESSSTSDALAFAAAVILKNRPVDIARSYIIDSAEPYNDLANESIPLIIITTVLQNAYYPVSKGHSVIQCVTKEDKYQGPNKIILPNVDRHGFLDSLKASGIDSNQANQLLRDSNRESSSLRRILGINIEKPSWEDKYNLQYIIPALLLGSWDSSCDADKEMVSIISGMDYSEFEKGVNDICLSSESPIVKVRTIWKIKSPKLLMSRIYSNISQEHINKYKEIFNLIIEDDDPHAKAKKKEKTLRFWDDKHLFSGSLREGIVQTITLLAVVEEENGASCRWIDELIKEKLDKFDVLRYLSNRNNLLWMTEASPSAFIDYIDKDIRNGAPIINELFKIERKQFSLSGSEIYFTELLTSLECLSWDINYLPKTTELLLYFCDYPNDSNYINKPIQSLYNIYRFLLPQTLVDFEERLEILSVMINKYQKATCELLFMMFDGIKNTTGLLNSQFRWRLSDKIKTPKASHPISSNHIIDVTNLLITHIDMTEVNICKLIELSSKKFMSCSRKIILNRINLEVNTIKGNEKIFDCIRKDMAKHRRYRSAKSAISEEDLSEYQKLLDAVAPNDAVIEKKYYFDNFLIVELYMENSNDGYRKKIEESRILRVKVLADIIDKKGDNGIWELSNVAKNKDCVAIALSDLKGDSYIFDVYSLYCQQKLDNTFVCRYFLELYSNNGYDKYLEYVNKLNSVNPLAIAMLLYAPGVNMCLCHLVESMPEEIQKEYWSKVQVFHYEINELIYIINHMKAVGRYSEILHMFDCKEVCDELTIKQVLDILFEMMDKGEYQTLKQDIYYVAEILKSVNIPSESEKRNKLLLLELTLFDNLSDYMNTEDIHLLDIIGKEPELMIEIASMAYLEDEEFRQEDNLTQVEKSQREVFAYLAWGFLYNYHGVPGLNNDDSIDYEFLKHYIKRLYELAKLKHRTQIIPFVVGKILGNIPENNDYPSDALCKIVEELNDDKIDIQIQCCLSNRRGMTTRSPFEGGTIEREHIKTFKKYKESVMLRSPRLVKIYDNEIRDYEHMAEKEDQMAKLEDLRF